MASTREKLTAADHEVDYVVVGAGFAGLVVARELVRAGKSVAVLEARDRVGGRVVNEPIGDGKVVEAGGEWIGPTQHRIRALADELGIDVYPTYHEGKNVIEFKGKVSRYSGTIPRLGPLTLVDTGLAMWRVDRLARKVPVEAPWDAPNAKRIDAQSLGTWVRRNVRTSGARELMRVACGAVWSVEPDEISLLHALFYINAAGGFDALLSTAGGAQHYRLEGGSQVVALKIAEELGDRVMLGSPVRRIVQDDECVTVITDRSAVRGRRAIVTLPPPLTTRIEYVPQLPAERDQLAQRMPMGSVIKCQAIYDEPFWRADGLTGEAVSTTGPVSFTFDNTPPDGTPGVILGFVAGHAAREFARLAPEERRRAAAGSFARLYGERAASPDGYVELIWADEVWSRGGPVAAFVPGGWTEFGPALRTPVGRIHWAGTETATVWHGFLDGAVQSGERAATEVLAAETS